MLPKIFRSYWKISVLVILVALAGRAVFNIYGRYQNSRASLALAEKELVAMENKKVILEKVTTELKTEQGIEKEIRQKYQVTKGSEQLIVIVDDEQKKPTETAPKTKGLWQSILEFFDINQK
ncbi:MAG: hypothetical protein A3D52_03305 [Candidatus Taylorbacteria bacterium RIFCSPHIGHO2_02_FULL_44_36]|uniref:Uncharacterized protein n=1 Tax=Candidatus Taylorbacteria bacterium RIFCSPLOWO2_12_FULL_44_15c TaxID=1802333 RepID=A0A1G2P3W7_9BACT|nr:MAG: hypothetical protein A3D52_03305 [Candidatus Taylorbacteria bacterium RIFCSPHIGHO2_02_FULL_44_36]OHA38416.1 MAG: hypothetical protein A3I97_01185 [Candidatus Taylorbacteria bacterium RIFCSPLOWO2_02_FULL_44_35]OHA43026.1 MAG: hypothetical protein A3G03_03080 [Candidatus Taylorbacteria bacterium RIFCSPLOWO2_12_FULL_44_15c]